MWKITFAFNCLVKTTVRHILSVLIFFFLQFHYLCLVYFKCFFKSKEAGEISSTTCYLFRSLWAKGLTARINEKTWRPETQSKNEPKIINCGNLLVCNFDMQILWENGLHYGTVLCTKCLNKKKKEEKKIYHCVHFTLF